MQEPVQTAKFPEISPEISHAKAVYSEIQA